MTLKIYFFRNTTLAKNMVTPFGSDIKSQAFDQMTQFIEFYVFIRQAAQYPKQQFVVFSHFYSVIPASLATVLMSLSPRPERFTSNTLSLPMVGAIFIACARAWLDSSAGMMPSKWHRS